MSATILDGKAIAAEIRAEAASAAQQLIDAGTTPALAVVLIGNNPASAAYVGSKIKACAECGIESIERTADSDISESELLSIINDLNNDASVHGILVQLPLPDHIDENSIIEAVHPDKDVDGFHPINTGRLVAGSECLAPCTPAGIPELISRSGFTTSGKHAVIIGRSNIVGKPMMNILVQKAENANCTVTCCHSGTPDLAVHTKQADILIAAIGVADFVTADMVKPGALVIDVGINRVDDDTRARGYRLTGDVDFDSVSQVAEAISPVPGGVGPMTVAMLMKNTVAAATRLTE
ncbi:MAG: bifunctional methylenetetrahydrofolate dehydrogenase/methenyltetrahydrofolate cyclohydrolase FolD [Proteobacteria bacterium]|jgi:methylenetetrahydrofolate dehydrogenase (NADP+) / methenyltetrahydrofolate cyclohydrolase|nr:bifunctional methylenetetrahydrofolate dehydrogenase/methenyltetrahydrofolate cyclohydrolase FolD [Pseudomonadota bacterium]